MSLKMAVITILTFSEYNAKCVFKFRILNTHPGENYQHQQLLQQVTSQLHSIHEGVDHVPYHDHHHSPSKATFGFLANLEYISYKMELNMLFLASRFIPK